LINTLGMKTGSEKVFGAGYNILPIWKQRLDAKTLVTTPNSDVIYAMSYVDLGKDGPLVFEAPPMLQGILLDFWRGRPSGALTPAQGCTQGTRPCTSSAMILPVISWYRLVLSEKDLWAGVGWGMGSLRDGRAKASLSPLRSSRMGHRPLPFPASVERFPSRPGKPGASTVSPPLFRRSLGVGGCVSWVIGS